ncbi:CDP-alcohol phosphatidyltransferase family protein [Vibrio cholerae]|uniref:CDP-alcohol phosphatidyltransferase family protein n=2 Tax=Vibrio cholerae TaxID=666 RepID=UPI0013C3FEEE|nr:CDP-alcohol phosphatidyltransferase family protein [Vibrio cholerae]HAS4573392.1 CDP-alcohol phosphatidyltransferase family protein [Vibrio cholerae]HDI3281995.1 CDP-alcohol phosphatidyltransferase family protein [Vibrio cholerae]HDL9434003.1 CDP-alcohol phosphatidyltransferase family protein [Vibrio cholerae]HDZ9634798.1 CDP-alcohol phosphatidyltransferase family protein [Vibrio cholerae]
MRIGGTTSPIASHSFYVATRGYMDKTQSEEKNRRPLAVRDLNFTKRIAVWLSQKQITPNQISLMSIAFALLGCAILAVYHYYPAPLWLILAALSIQARLLCNLFDGMVAVEGGKKTPAGELFNDVPDRIADPLLILGAGFVTTSALGMALAWLCALLAVLTAYIRVLGVSMGGEADFQGPMAKQHRMALLTLSLLFIAALSLFDELPTFFAYTMDITLIVMLIGLVLTVWRRLQHIYQFHAARASSSDHQGN